jgi:hypothetical protein
MKLTYPFHDDSINGLNVVPALILELEGRVEPALYGAL